MSTYLDLLTKDILINSIFKYLHLRSIYRLIEIIRENFTDIDYQRIYGILYPHGYDVLINSAVKFSCEVDTWEEKLRLIMNYDALSDESFQSYDIICDIYIRYLRGYVRYYIEVGDFIPSMTFSNSQLIRSLLYRGFKPVEGDNLSDYDNGRLESIYFSYLHGSDIPATILISISLILKDFSIFEIMLKDIYIEMEKGSNPNAYFYGQKLQDFVYLDEDANEEEKVYDIIDRILSCGYYDFIISSTETFAKISLVSTLLNKLVDKYLDYSPIRDTLIVSLVNMLTASSKFNN